MVALETYPFYFKVKLFIDGKYYAQSGLGLTSSFAEATKQLEEIFGTDLISIEHLELGEYDKLIMLPDDICRKYMYKENYGDLVPIPDEEV